MLLLGHMGITALAASMIYLPAFGAIIGVLLPDVVDKSLFLLGAPCGRFVAHSIFFFPVAGIFSYLITRNKKFAIAVALGSFLHILEDLNWHVPFLFPIKNYAFFATCATFEFEITTFVILTEIVGGLLLVFIYGFNKNFLYVRKVFWKFIKLNGLYAAQNKRID